MDVKGHGDSMDEEDTDLRREDQDWGKMSRQDGSFGKIKMEVK